MGLQLRDRLTQTLHDRDIEAGHFDSISSITNALASQVNDIDNRLSDQMQALVTIKNSVDEFSQSQQSQSSAIISEMSSQVSALSLQLDSVTQNLNHLVRHFLCI